MREACCYRFGLGFGILLYAVLMGTVSLLGMRNAFAIRRLLWDIFVGTCLALVYSEHGAEA